MFGSYFMSLDFRGLILKASGDVSLSSLFSTQSLLKHLEDIPISCQIFFTKNDPEMVFRLHES